MYRHLTAGLDGEQREQFDGELYAPAQGWDAVEADLWRRLDAAAVVEGGD